MEDLKRITLEVKATEIEEVKDIIASFIFMLTVISTANIAIINDIISK